MRGLVFLVWCVLPVIILLFFSLKPMKKTAVIRKHLRDKRMSGKGEKFDMLNLINRFIGKKCDISTIDEEYTGVIESVEENWLVVRSGDSDAEEIINLEYVTIVRQCREKKKKLVSEKQTV